MFFTLLLFEIVNSACIHRAYDECLSLNIEYQDVCQLSEGQCLPRPSKCTDIDATYPLNCKTSECYYSSRFHKCLSQPFTRLLDEIQLSEDHHQHQGDGGRRGYEHEDRDGDEHEHENQQTYPSGPSPAQPPPSPGPQPAYNQTSTTSQNSTMPKQNSTMPTQNSTTTKPSGQNSTTIGSNTTSSTNSSQGPDESQYNYYNGEHADESSNNDGSNYTNSDPIAQYPDSQNNTETMNYTTTSNQDSNIAFADMDQVDKLIEGELEKQFATSDQKKSLEIVSSGGGQYQLILLLITIWIW